MMIYITSSTYSDCARIHKIDMLLRQRQNIYLIYKALTASHTRSKWLNHPTAWMWRGSHAALAAFGDVFDREVSRRTKNKVKPLFSTRLYYYDPSPPWWFSAHQLKYNHVQLLLQRDPEWYQEAFQGTEMQSYVYDKPYLRMNGKEIPIWPVTREGQRSPNFKIKGVFDGDID